MNKKEAIKILEAQKNKLHTEEYKNNVIAQTLDYIEEFLGKSSQHYELIEKLKNKYPNISGEDFDEKAMAIENAFSAYIVSAIETIKNKGIKNKEEKWYQKATDAFIKNAVQFIVTGLFTFIIGVLTGKSCNQHSNQQDSKKDQTIIVQAPQK